MVEYPTKKWLGQHWLTDPAVLAAVVEAAVLQSDDVVLEVGPGPGSLTELLVTRAQQVVAIEKDPRLAAALATTVNAVNLEVECEDVLEFDLSKLPTDYKVVANIPYYLTSNLLRNFLESVNPPCLMSLMVQKEVAERIVAVPGQMSMLAFSVQYYAEPRLVRLVSKELFKPVPQVDSAILQIKRRSQPMFTADRAALFQIVKAGFAGKRKQLKNSLAAGLHLPPADVARRFDQLGIEPKLRAQDLSLKQWNQIYKAFRPLIIRTIRSRDDET